MSAGHPTKTDAHPPVYDTIFAEQALAQMAFIREFEASALALTQTNPPRVQGSMHFCAGQEAVPVGAAEALRHDDQILATYRGHGWAIASGVDPGILMAEICHRRSGVNGGRAGSAYVMAPGTRFIGENSIVGAGSTIACGLAIANLIHGNERVVIVSVGDGALNQGSVHEAMAFAAVRRLPIIFICENNGWSELTPTRDMFTVDRLARRANGYNISSATIDGTDPFIVRDSITAAADRCRKGAGPVFLECMAPRLWGHYHRDIEHYRSKADKVAAASRDPVELLANRLISAGTMSRSDVEGILLEQKRRAVTVTDAALLDVEPDSSQAQAHVVAKPSHRSTSLPLGQQRQMTYIEAVNAALHSILASDPDAILFGEDVAKPGGVFGATRNLQRDFGKDRVFDTPIAENAILGSALGAALGGLKPIVEIMWADFLFVALDQLVNQAANIRYVTQGQCCASFVVRTQQGATPGSCAQHSQSIEAILAHVPGLRVALAATPQDAYDLLRSAAADPDPCIIIEHRALYQTSNLVAIDKEIEPVGAARLHRMGGDVAVITWGAMLPRAIEAAEILSKRGIEVSVLDLRWLSPLDETALMEVVSSSGGNVLVVHEAVRTGGFAAEVAMRLQEICGSKLSRQVRRLTTPDVRIPASPTLQAALLPTASSIVSSVEALLQKPKNGLLQ